MALLERFPCLARPVIAAKAGWLLVHNVARLAGDVSAVALHIGVFGKTSILVAAR